MKIEEVRQRAYSVGLQGISRMRKADLIRAVQRQEGNQPCYGASWRMECESHECCWREDCQSGHLR